MEWFKVVRREPLFKQMYFALMIAVMWLVFSYGIYDLSGGGRLVETFGFIGIFALFALMVIAFVFMLDAFLAMGTMMIIHVAHQVMGYDVALVGLASAINFVILAGMGGVAMGKTVKKKDFK